MSWNYRLIETKERFSIFEVLYKEDGSISGYAIEPILNFYCKEPSDILHELEVLNGVFEKPPLNMKQLSKHENT